MLLVLLAYANALGNRFTNWDDEHLIVRNKAIRTVDAPFLIANFHLSYPPLTVLTHCVDYAFWRLNPVGYHITDLLIYALIVISFFLLADRITRNRRAALAAAALFAAHPLHVESVTWLSSRKDGLGTLFYLLAFLAYLRSGPRPRGGFLWLSVLFYFCALWTKPLTVTLPLALALYVLLLGRTRPHGTSHAPPGSPAPAKVLLNITPYAIPLALTALAALFLDPHNEISRPWHGGSPAATFRAAAVVLGDYLRMLVLPVRLSALYVVYIPARLSAPGCWLPLAAVGALLIAAARSARRHPLFSFCTFWGAASLLPVLQIVPVNIVKADRYLYLPTAALCLALGGAAMAPARPRRAAALAVIAAVAALTLLTISRNTAWRDSTSLWSSVISLDPENADALNNLGIAQTREKRYRAAERTLRHALALRPDFASAHNNLANVYRLTGRYDDALEEYRKAGGLTGDIVYAASLYAGMGMTYEAKGEYGSALAAYEKAARTNPVYLDDAFLRGRIAECRVKARGGEAE